MLVPRADIADDRFNSSDAKTVPRLRYRNGGRNRTALAGYSLNPGSKSVATIRFGSEIRLFSVARRDLTRKASGPAPLRQVAAWTSDTSCQMIGFARRAVAERLRASNRRKRQ